MTKPADQEAAGRTIAIGDIHGCSAALDVLLRELSLTATDTVIVLGDVVDRGPDTKGCIDRLLELKHEARFLHIMGNHEEMMLDAYVGGPWANAWLRYGGQEMLDSYGGSFDAIPEEHLDFIRSGMDFFATGNAIFAHAAINPAQTMEQQTVHFLRWNRIVGNEPPHVSGRPIVCGHTAQPSGRPLVFDGWCCVDTCVYGPSGALSALAVEENLIYRSCQHGEFLGIEPASDFT
ncbi:MAG: serine/threonine protein phosphatase [Planctomycetota bacterium]|nr:MAG: serine/threonine protein phosphatase [Planctomycetota bacterium]REK31545.1 MAG: serine/threonine protein phosphatase [Planctomycetota bacterium]